MNATLENGILTLENSRIARVYDWNGGRLRTLRIVDKRAGRAWDCPLSVPDTDLPGLPPPTAPAAFTQRCVAESAVLAAHVEAVVDVPCGQIALRHVFRVFEDCPAIGYTLFVKGRSAARWDAAAVAVGDLANVEDVKAVGAHGGGTATLDRLALPGTHWRVTAVEFTDITDRNNNLVQERTVLPYRSGLRLHGNLLLATPVLEGDAGLFWLKEAPCSGVQLGSPGADFDVKTGELRMVGLGLAPEDLEPDTWVRAYGSVVGVSDGGRLGQLAALRAYHKTRRLRRKLRDDMVLMNTWGDRSQDKALGEAFAVAELERGHQLGITHFQLDDGWQKGRSHNSAFKDGAFPDIARMPDYWTPHPERFPRGLGPVVVRGRELGIEVCLWFNPSSADHYAAWRKDADALVEIHRAHGVRTFKMDGINIPDKRSETNLRKLFDAVVAATGGEAVFNLDVTAMRRFGYNYFAEYGNLFLENRYTDWTNYYPHWTLRNLWQLAAYVPPETLQIEFLNVWRNAEKYPTDDPLAPSRVPFETAIAISLAAQPLAWLESTRLPEEAFGAARLLKAYRHVMRELHDGVTLPIGEEPDGLAWTGFQSIGKNGRNGFLIVVRECSPDNAAQVQTWLPSDTAVTLRRLAGDGADLDLRTDAQGRLRIVLPQPWTYAFYRYELRR
jgi:hypothetical protein